MSRARIHKFLLILLERGEWHQVEAEELADLTQPRWTSEPSACVVCGDPMTKGIINYSYMLHDAIWKSAGMKPSDLSHIGCFEQKLGRELVRSDFRPCPMNAVILWMFDNKISIPKD
jgi:hypothetical protein